jgi:hypothetical protein
MTKIGNRSIFQSKRIFTEKYGFKRRITTNTITQKGQAAQSELPDLFND